MTKTKSLSSAASFIDQRAKFVVEQLNRLRSDRHNLAQDDPDADRGCDFPAGVLSHWRRGGQNTADCDRVEQATAPGNREREVTYHLPFRYQC